MIEKIKRTVCEGQLVSQNLQCTFWIPATVAIIKNCLQSFHHRPPLSTVCGLSCSRLFISNPEFPTLIIPVLQLPSHSHSMIQKILCHFPLSCAASHHLFLFWDVYTVLLVPFPTTLFPGFCSSGCSQGDLLSVMFWSPPLQIRNIPKFSISISFLIIASKTTSRHAFSCLALSHSQRNTALG